MEKRGKHTEIISDRSWLLRAPANLTPLRVKQFRDCVREISSRVRMEGEAIQLCLNEVNRLSVVAMVELARWCGEFDGRRGLVSLSGGTAQVGECFRIVGLGGYLGGTELEPASRPAGAGTPDRQVVPVDETADDEDLVLGSDALWE
ncbi:MAG: hypothetical protein ABL994_12655 [Verrucomicrobiales bacterium]